MLIARSDRTAGTLRTRTRTGSGTTTRTARATATALRHNQFLVHSNRIAAQVVQLLQLPDRRPVPARDPRKTVPSHHRVSLRSRRSRTRRRRQTRGRARRTARRTARRNQKLLSRPNNRIPVQPVDRKQRAQRNVMPLGDRRQIVPALHRVHSRRRSFLRQRRIARCRRSRRQRPQRFQRLQRLLHLRPPTSNRLRSRSRRRGARSLQRLHLRRIIRILPIELFRRTRAGNRSAGLLRLRTRLGLAAGLEKYEQHDHVKGQNDPEYSYNFHDIKTLLPRVEKCWRIRFSPRKKAAGIRVADGFSAGMLPLIARVEQIKIPPPRLILCIVLLLMVF